MNVTACEPCEGHGRVIKALDVVRCRTCRGTGRRPSDDSSPAGRHVARRT